MMMMMLITLPLRLCEAETGQQREWINTPSAACIACLHCSAWVRHANAAHLNLCGDSVAVIFPLSPVVRIVGHWDRLGVALGGFFSSPLYWTAVGLIIVGVVCFVLTVADDDDGYLDTFSVDSSRALYKVNIFHPVHVKLTVDDKIGTTSYN
ncbi:hypothetical protein T08_5587 [Trichinella sp. T8]|nr:hypothetical protein T08_5587 [Trichinella sp. T8]